jgi:hypothetical protein
MPNTTLTANSAAMPSRRGALGAIAAAAGAILAAPCAAGAVDLDAELFALQGSIEAADRVLDAAYAALRIAEKKKRPCAPERPADPAVDRERLEAINASIQRIVEIRAQGPSAEQAAHQEALRQWEAD